MSPFWILRDKTVNSFRFVTSFVSFKSSLIKENDRLKEELAGLRLNEIDYDILVKENEELKSEFGRASSDGVIIAGVLSKPPQSPYDTFVIDVGSNSAVSVGNKVYISNRIIIGSISSVTEKTGVVKLFSTGGEKQEVISDRTGASFVITGSGGADFELEVPKDTDIVWGDSFLYPGLNSAVLSTVYYIDVTSQSSFKIVHARVPGNVFQVRRVFVENDL